MLLTLANEAEETDNRSVSWRADDITDGATHLQFSGDMIYLKGDDSKISNLFLKRSSYTANSMNGEMVLADGFGVKVVQAKSIYKAAESLVGMIRSDVVVGPITQYRLLPLFQSLVSTDMVGGTVSKSISDFATVTGIVEDAGVLYYLLDSSWSATALDPVYFSRSFDIDSSAPDAITYTDGNDPVFVYPNANVDVAPFWDTIYSFWRNISDEDQAMIEAIWQGMSHDWGNLMQRLYEADMAESIFDMLIYRRKHWAAFDCRHQRYTGTGGTSASEPNMFFDKTASPFEVAASRGGDIDSEGRFISVGGRSYKILEAVSVSKVRLEGANFQTRTGLDYSIGLQDETDLYDDSFSSYIGRVASVLLDSNQKKSLNNVDDISYAEIDGIADGGRVRYSTVKFEGGEVLAGEPDTVYWEDPIFNHSFHGASLNVLGTSYWVSSIASDRKSVVLAGAALPTGTIGFSIDQPNFSTFNGVQFTAGSKVISLTSGTFMFSANDIGASVIVPSGPNAGIYKVSSYISDTSVELGIAQVATQTESVTVPCDVIVDLANGFVQRQDYGRIEDCSTISIKYFIRVKARMLAGVNVKEVESLQEAIRLPESPGYDIVSRKVYGDLYFGHKNIITAIVKNEQGISLMPGDDYVLDNETGIATIPSQSSISTGDSITIEVDYTPYLGREGFDYFLESDGFIYFRENPSVKLWAPEVYYDKEDPYNKYGQYIGFYQENSEKYYLALIALWTTYLLGPRPEFIEQGISILMGLPFAVDDGTVLSISLRRVGLGERWVVSIDYDSLGVQQIELPKDLQPFVAVGERLSRFDMLTGLVQEFGATATLRGRSISDAIEAPFAPENIGGKIWIPFGDNSGVYEIDGFISSSQLSLLKSGSHAGRSEFLTEIDVPYKLLVPAVRSIDHVDDKEFLTRHASYAALAKYFTQNTTDAEKAIAAKLLSPNIFLSQINALAFNDFPDVLEITRFLRRVKPQYVDFIMQIVDTETEEFSLLEGDKTLPDISMDLTSTLSWFAAWLPPVLDPFTLTQIPNGYVNYLNGDNSGTPDFYDATNSPFTADDVGRSIFIPGAWRYFNGGTVSPTAPSNEFFVASVSPVFSASDVGKGLIVESLGVRTKITQYINPFKVLVEHEFTTLAIGLAFSVEKEANKGEIREIVSFVSPSHVGLNGSFLSGDGAHYFILRPEDFLDDENLSFAQDIEVTVFDAGFTLIDQFNIVD